MIITDKQIIDLFMEYARSGKSKEQCLGFIDGVEKIVELLTQKNEKK